MTGKSLNMIAAAIFMLLALLPVACFAQNVEHHGFRVDTDEKLGDCMSCHDGVTAGSVNFCLVKCDFRSPHSAMKEYPPLGKERKYVSAGDVLRKGIILVDGKVTCISCHDLGNNTQDHLVIPMDKSKLCFACHLQ